MNVICYNYREGCDWRSIYVHYERHIREKCLHQKFKCRFEGCGKVVTRLTQNKHEAKCQFRLVPCKMCNQR